MHRLAVIAVSVATTFGGTCWATEEDPVENKLKDAKDQYGIAVEKASARLLSDLDRKKQVAQKAGDLKTLEAVEREIKAFKEERALPLSVSSKTYEGQVQTARAKLERAYETAIRQYTKDGKLDLAKKKQEEFDQFHSRYPSPNATPPDPLVVQSIWVDENRQITLTINERDGDGFSAVFQVGNLVGSITGTLKDDKIDWRSRFEVPGQPGVIDEQSGTAILGKDKAGNMILWRQQGTKGESILRHRGAETGPIITADGFQTLFDGTTLKGWKYGRIQGAEYVAENGILVCPQGSFRNLFSEKEYSDFELRLDFRMTPGGNNGIAVRAPLQGEPALVGMEVQLLDDDAPAHKSYRPDQLSGSIYGVVAARRGAQKPVGEWNSMQIRCEASRIRVTLNDQVVVDANTDSIADPEIIKKFPGIKRKSGHIGFAGHGSRVEFKNIRIKSISDL